MGSSSKPDASCNAGPILRRSRPVVAPFVNIVECNYTVVVDLPKGGGCPVCVCGTWYIPRYLLDRFAVNGCTSPSSEGLNRPGADGDAMMMPAVTIKARQICWAASLQKWVGTVI